MLLWQSGSRENRALVFSVSSLPDPSPATQTHNVSSLSPTCPEGVVR